MVSLAIGCWSNTLENTFTLDRFSWRSGGMEVTPPTMATSSRHGSKEMKEYFEINPANL